MVMPCDLGSGPFSFQFHFRQSFIFVSSVFSGFEFIFFVLFTSKLCAWSFSIFLWFILGVCLIHFFHLYHHLCHHRRHHYCVSPLIILFVWFFVSQLRASSTLPPVLNSWRYVNISATGSWFPPFVITIMITVVSLFHKHNHDITVMRSWSWPHHHVIPLFASLSLLYTRDLTNVQSWSRGSVIASHSVRLHFTVIIFDITNV